MALGALKRPLSIIQSVQSYALKASLCSVYRHLEYLHSFYKVDEQHSMFNIPVKNLHEDLFCSIPKNGQCADLLHATKAIIWDEIEAQHRHAVETLGWTLQDIRNDEQLFRGITVILGGDFLQTLPVVP